MVTQADPPAWIVVVVGDQAGPNVARAAGPFAIEADAQKFREMVAEGEDDPDSYAVVSLEHSDAPDAFAIGYR